MIQALKRINLKVFAVLLVAGLLGVLAILPYMIDFLGSRTVSQASAPDIPLPSIRAEGTTTRCESEAR